MSRALQCRCDFPGCTMPAALVRTFTYYLKEEDNWAYYCGGHEEEADEYWRSRWEDYYQAVYPAYPYR